jgi:hypothetical protein
MWPFRRKKKIPKPGRMVKQVVTGVIIGGAIGSIVGKKLMEQHAAKDEQDEDENGFTTKDI